MREEGRKEREKEERRNDSNPQKLTKNPKKPTCSATLRDSAASRRATSSASAAAAAAAAATCRALLSTPNLEKSKIQNQAEADPIGAFAFGEHGALGVDWSVDMQIKFKRYTINMLISTETHSINAPFQNYSKSKKSKSK